MAPARRLFCFGLGYTAVRVAESLGDDGWSLAGTCRGEAKRAGLAAQGIDAYRFDRARRLPNFAAALAGTTHLLISVPPDAEGDPVLAAHDGDIAALSGLEWVGYLSTTVVYGDRGGGWVDESDGLMPTGRRGSARVDAEKAWLALWRARGVPVHVFRLAGIYGPGRNALDQLRAGTARRIDKQGQVFSRIHVGDLVRVLRASMDRPDPGAIYNVCDDLPAPQHEVVAFAAKLLGLAPPPLVPFERAELSEAARGFYADNKRIRNDCMKRELGVKLKYPDYRTGLTALSREANETRGR